MENRFPLGEQPKLRRRDYRLSLKKEEFKMEKLANIHPGEILLEEFLKPMGISAYRLSKDTEIPQTRISQIMKGNRRITADTAMRLSAYFGNTPKFWLGLQDDFDIEEEKSVHSEIFNRIRMTRKNASQHAV